MNAQTSVTKSFVQNRYCIPAVASVLDLHNVFPNHVCLEESIEKLMPNLAIILKANPYCRSSWRLGQSGEDGEKGIHPYLPPAEWGDNPDPNSKPSTNCQEAKKMSLSKLRTAMKDQGLFWVDEVGQTSTPYSETAASNIPTMIAVFCFWAALSEQRWLKNEKWFNPNEYASRFQPLLELSGWNPTNTPKPFVGKGGWKKCDLKAGLWSKLIPKFKFRKGQVRITSKDGNKKSLFPSSSLGAIDLRDMILLFTTNTYVKGGCYDQEECINKEVMHDDLLKALDDTLGGWTMARNFFGANTNPS